jgi:hypothetical protein
MNLRDVAAALPFAHLVGLAPAPVPAALTGAPPAPATSEGGEGAPADSTAHLRGLPEQQQEASVEDQQQDAEAQQEEQPPTQAETQPPAAADPVALERARVAAILGAARPGMDRLAQVAVAEGFSADLFARLQDAVPAAADPGAGRRSLDERMQSAPNPQPGAGAPSAPQGADAAAAAILASARRARGEEA